MHDWSDLLLSTAFYQRVNAQGTWESCLLGSKGGRTRTAESKDAKPASLDDEMVQGTHRERQLLQKKTAKTLRKATAGTEMLQSAIPTK